MKLTAKHIFLTLTMLPGIVNVSCTDEFGPETAIGGDIEITVRSSSLKTRMAGDDTYNENKIDNLLFLFNDMDDTEDSVAVVKNFVGLKKTSTHTINLTLSRSERAKLFPNGATQCKMYVLVNYEGDHTALTSVAKAKGVEISSEFEKNKTLPHFVMDGSGQVVLTDPTNYRGSGTVEVTRLASRFNLNVTVRDADKNDIEFVTDVNGNKWRPDKENIIVCINDGVNKIPVGANPKTLELPETAYFKTTPSVSTQTKLQINTATGIASHSLPIYTYMNVWDTMDPKHMTYFIIQLPWKKDGEQSYRYCYYQVPASTSGLVDRNTAYTINLNIGMLGSFEEAEPFEIKDLKYSVMPWNTVEMGVEMNKVDYLVVNSPVLSVYNAETMSIPFYSTEECEVVSIEMSYPVFNMTGMAGRSAGQPAYIVADNTTAPSVFGEGKIVEYKIVKDTTPGAVNLYNLEIKHKLKDCNASVNGTAISYNSGGSTTTGFKPDEIYNDSQDNPKVYQVNNLTHKENQPSYSIITFKVTIKHKNGTGVGDFEKTLTFYQYPEMYITSEWNNNYGTFSTTAQQLTAVNTGSQWRPNYVYQLPWVSTVVTDANEFGYVFVNSCFDYENEYFQCKGKEEEAIKPTLFGSRNYNAFPANTSTTGNNQNPNIYTIHTTKLDNNSKFVLGDSRKNNYGTLTLASGQYWATAPALYPEGGADRTLSYYYESDDNANMISPAFKIASSYGKTTTVSLDDAKRRCASYQEMGYPAGRWRVPTTAEVAYIISLSAKGLIPQLFANDSRYWTATQSVIPRSNPTSYPDGYESSTSTTNTYVRCVYDEWFWGTEKCDKATFTWGDKPKTVN